MNARSCYVKLAIALVLGICLLPARQADCAESLQYAAIDRAVVRVVAGGAVDLVKTRVADRDLQLAMPAIGHGSGVVVSSDGLIVTAAHVVEDARAIVIEMPGIQEAMPASVVTLDKAKDFAILYARGSFPNVARLAEPNAMLRVRQTVFAIGYPLDVTRTDAQSSRGIVSGRLPDGKLQLDVAVNPGNSGGPAVDEQDVVQGIVVSRGRVEKGVIGMTFAVPTSTFRPALDAVIAAKTHLLRQIAVTQVQAKQLVDLAELLARDGNAMMHGSVDPTSDDGRKMQQRILGLVKQNPHASEILLFASAFFWNRHLVRWLRNEDYDTPRSAAIDMARRAAAIAPELRQQCMFVKVLLRGDPEPVSKAPAPGSS